MDFKTPTNRPRPPASRGAKGEASETRAAQQYAHRGASEERERGGGRTSARQAAARGTGPYLCTLGLFWGGATRFAM
eukprot:9502223-Pyramimonas_sp.AAC.1